MSRKIVSTDKAPAAIGPYSQAVISNGLVYCSGQIAIVPKTGEVLDGDVTAQAELVMNNIGEVLKAAGSGFDRVVKCSIFLDDMGDFNAVNEVYARYFISEPPAREAVAVETLPKNVKIEISCIAEA